MGNHELQYYDYIDVETYEIIKSLPFVEVYQAADARDEHSESLRLKGNVHCLAGIMQKDNQHWVRSIVHDYLKEWIEDCKNASDDIKEIFKRTNG
ncbi:hypothetical protein N9Y42_06110 [Mariniblastus sp.]|nr:hypothetical protein [Mariniblastus sp.]